MSKMITDNKETLINALAKIDELTKKLAFQDKWLSDGVYFTNAEYKKECSRNRATEAENQVLDSHIAKINFLLSDLGFPVGELDAKLDAAREMLETSILMPKVATDDMLYAYGAAERAALNENLSVEEAHQKVYQYIVEAATKKSVISNHPSPF